MNEKKTPRKLLIVLNYYTGDRDMAKSLAELIAALEPKQSEVADFMFHRRFDAEQMPTALKDRINEKFQKVHDIKCRRSNSVGYPYGPNEMFYDLMERMYNREWREKYYAFVNMEADCCPTQPGWIQKLYEEYTNAYNNNKAAVGHIHHAPNLTHLNGAAVYSTDFWQKAGGMNIIGGPANIAYDIYHAQRIVPLSLDSNAMLLDFNRKTISEEDLENLTKNGEKVFYLHGVKDESAIANVRKKYIGGVDNVPKALRTICTYYDSVPDCNAQEQKTLIEMWKTAWKKAGYNPVVFSEWDASKHALYPAIKAKLKNVKFTESRKKELAKIYRWLAFEYCGGGLMTEYDILPGSSFSGEDIPNPEAVVFLEEGGVSAVSADRRGLKFLTELLAEYAYDEMKPISDKEIIATAKDEFWFKQTPLVMEWASERWSQAKLVHFSLKACKAVSSTPHKPSLVQQHLKTLTG